MAKIPQEVMDYIEDHKTRTVLSTIEADGILFSGVRGRLIIMDDESIAFCDVAQVKRKPAFVPGQQVSFVITNPPSFGYQIYGSFKEYCTSGEKFERQAAQMSSGPHSNILERMGVVTVERVYAYTSEDRTEHGMQIL